MEPKDLIIDALGRIQQLVSMAVTGLTPDQLAKRPAEHSNSIAWLTWHLSRVQDHHFSDLEGRPQLWVASGWHDKLGKPADPRDTGFGYGPEQVAAIRPAGPEVLLDYHNAVYEASKHYLQGDDRSRHGPCPQRASVQSYADCRRSVG